MMTPEQMKTWIDNATYEQLLARWRFAAVGDPFFIGETGDYYEKSIAAKKKKVGDNEAVRASKAVGWEK